MTSFFLYFKNTGKTHENLVEPWFKIKWVKLTFITLNDDYLLMIHYNLRNSYNSLFKT